MDDRETKDIAREPAEIRDDMRDTRAAMTEKLEILEDRMTKRVEDLQHRVESTVDKVHDSVQHTVRTLKRTVDWRHQVDEHPWAMFGGAVLAGFVATRFAASGQVRSTVRDSHSAVSAHAARLNPASEHSVMHGAASGLLDKAVGQIDTQVARLERAAVSAAGEFVERLIAQAIPGLAPHLHNISGKSV